MLSHEINEGCYILVSEPGYREPDTVISDLEDFMVTYTEAPPSADYVPGLKHPLSPAYVPEFGPEPVYLEACILKVHATEDDVVPAKEQPLPVVILPTADSPGYITESDPEEDLEEEDDEDPEEDPADYPTDKDDKEEEEESSRDDADDEEEEEHLASTDSVLPPAYHTTARMSIRAQTSIPLPSEIKVGRLLAIPPPPPLPLTSYSSPLPQIPSLPLPASPTHPLGYRAAMIRTSKSETPPSGTPPPLPIPLPTSSPPLLLPSTDHRADFPEVTLQPQKRLRAESPSTSHLLPSSTPPSGTPPLLHIPLPTSSSPLILPFMSRRADVPKTHMAALQRQQEPARDLPRPEVPEEAS
nr:hypothetical protein [Tanacetum cinerariifolium]